MRIKGEFLDTYTVLLDVCVVVRVTCDHDDPYASLPTHSDGAKHLFPGGVQHAHTAHKGQVRLGRGERWKGRRRRQQLISLVRATGDLTSKSSISEFNVQMVWIQCFVI